MLLKNLALCLGLVVTVFLFLAFSQNLSAQDEDIDSVTKAQLAKEGSLTKKDIDLYVKFYERFYKTGDNVKKSNSEINKFTNNFIKENKLTAVRTRYLLEKITITMMSISYNEKAPNPNAPAHLRYSSAERRLVEANSKKILPFIQKLQGR
ncbi:MAG: hypothetical protein LBT38_03505 [Deltaproteobacteria bacterium]|jgi:hypothetical protein|nr:hypothetical protein [Deltaproteobacteria bacterium]